MEKQALFIENLSHSFGNTKALDRVTFSVEKGALFGLLGPNGGGKTTLFRILSSLITPTEGGTFTQLDKSSMGVVFQSPSLDKKLTVFENLMHQGHLYGIRGPALGSRIDEVLKTVGLLDRKGNRVEVLSGGLSRRAEIAKALLHKPSVLLMDEPTTGLDPGARIDVWLYLRSLKEEGVTTLVTTHLMEEAEQCDNIIILDHGKNVASGSPESLRSQIGGEVLTIQSKKAAVLKSAIEERFQVKADVIDNTLRLESPQAYDLMKKLKEEFEKEVESITLAKPSLEDVFLKATGHRFWKS